MAVISAETIKSVASLEAALEAWPSALSLRSVQAGGHPEFWEKIGFDPERVLPGRDDRDWSAFWNAVCPHGCIMYFSPGAVKDEKEDAETGEYERADFGENCFTSASGAATEVFRRVVAGQLSSEDPTFVLQTRRGVILYWLLERGDQ